jgi:hypothetical protein
LVLLALLVAGGLLTLGWLVGGLIALGDRCAANPHALTCSNRGIEEAISWLAYSLPPIGLLSGLVLGAVRGGMDIRRGRTGLRWAAWAWVVFGVTLIVAFAVMNI